MHILHVLQLVGNTGWTVILFLVSGFRVFRRIRSQGELRWLSFLDQPASKLNAYLKWRHRYPGDSSHSYIPDDEEQFYSQFTERLRKAKTAIYNSGDGFDMIMRARFSSPARSAEKADQLDGSIIEALEANPELVYHRFQITSACNINYVGRLIHLKKRFGDRVEILINPTYDHLGCFCTIDPDDPINCIFEWQILSGRLYMNDHATKGYGFIYENSEICGKLKKIFDEISDEESTNKIMGDETKGTMTVGRLLLFQKQLWDERIGLIYRNPDHQVFDSEIRAIFKKRNVNRHSFEPSEMEFRTEDFPEVSYPITTNGAATTPQSPA